MYIGSRFVVKEWPPSLVEYNDETDSGTSRGKSLGVSLRTFGGIKDFWANEGIVFVLISLSR